MKRVPKCKLPHVEKSQLGFVATTVRSFVDWREPTRMQSGFEMWWSLSRKQLLPPMKGFDDLAQLALEIATHLASPSSLHAPITRHVWPRRRPHSAPSS